MDEGAPETATRDVIRGHFVLDRADVQRALFEGGRPTFFKLMAFVVAWPAFWGISRLMTGSGEGFNWWVPVGTLGIGIPALVFGFIRGGTSKILENKTAAERDITFEFDAAGYRIVTPRSDARAEWATVHRTAEGKTTFFIYPASHAFQLIPKRAFRDEDIPRIRELLRMRVTPRKVKSPLRRAVVLWVVLIVVFLAIWQFLAMPEKPRQSDEQRQTK